MALFNGLQIIRVHSWLTNNAVLYCLIALSQPPIQQYGYRLSRKAQRNHEQNPVEEYETGTGRAPSSTFVGLSLPPPFTETARTSRYRSAQMAYGDFHQRLLLASP